MPVVDLVLTSDDLARVRLLPMSDPIREIQMAAHVLSSRRTDPLFRAWARRTASGLAPIGSGVLSLLNSAVVQISDVITRQALEVSVVAVVGSGPLCVMPAWMRSRGPVAHRWTRYASFDPGQSTVFLFGA